MGNIIKRTATLLFAFCLTFCFSGTCKKSPAGPEPQQPTIGNLIGTTRGLIQGGTITSGTAYLRRSEGGAKECTATINSDGAFEILNIQNPQEIRIRRIGLESSQGINRETNINLNPGDNTAEINMIESDNVTGYYYEDYDTVNCVGARIVSNRPLKLYFYNKSVWEWNGNKWNAVGTVEEDYIDALAKIRDVYKNDFPIMTRHIHTDTEILLESNGAEGPGIPGASDKKEGWLVIFISKGIYGLRTGFLTNSNNEIVSARLRIQYSKYQPIYSRGAYSEDICEWAGFIDLLQKSDYSIFSNAEQGYFHGEYPYPFDKDYIAVIKYNRLPGHRSQYNIPDYDPAGRTGSGIHVAYSRFSNQNKSTGKDYKSWWLKDPAELGHEFAERVRQSQKHIYKRQEQRKRKDHRGAWKPETLKRWLPSYVSEPYWYIHLMTIHKSIKIS